MEASTISETKRNSESDDHKILDNETRDLGSNMQLVMENVNALKISNGNVRISDLTRNR